MPDNTTLLDPSPYVLAQTDLLIQLGSTQDFINRWVLESALEPQELQLSGATGNAPEANDNAQEADDIVTAIKGWAVVADVHAGFQRVDGRNLLGFNDGVSNPRRLSPLFEQVVWTTEEDEGPRPEFIDGTYMVFQKITHDLDQWRALDRKAQEQWIGRSKGTGLLLGTLDEETDTKLALGLRSNDPAVRAAALKVWEPLFKAQTDPDTRFFDHVDGIYEGKPKYGDIPNQCPAWSHVRKANQREEDGQYIPHLIFRRGYPFMENSADNDMQTGLLFVCFQHDISQGFEFIKTIWLNSSGFPVPLHDARFAVPRVFTPHELMLRHARGRFTVAELQALTPAERQLLGYTDERAFQTALQEARDPRTQETGREGLAGPSANGVTPTGEMISTVALGGGYYFVPPIPNRNLAEIGQQFFS
jgi:Dyp-type peroxidase family